jgi:ribosomal protein S12 methylthiotransferase
MVKQRSFHVITLGCAKNTVDSDSMAQLLQTNGYMAVDDPAKAQMILVNTCGFIAPAREESLAVLSELAARKQPGQYLIAAGCLTQRYGQQVLEQVAGIDGLLGTRRWMDVVDVVQTLRNKKYPQPLYHLPCDATVGRDERGVLRASLQGASSYLKIADGCRRPCAFCAIPLIKGTAVSRPVETILADARQLHEAGVKEIILISQDITDYGVDLGMKDGLAQLLEKLVQAVPEVPWLRLMYAYPGYVTDRLIEVIATQPQILPYLDIPLQHAHPQMLKRMKRPADIEWVQRTLNKMRRAMPDLAIRTTFIVGYPGETEAEFQVLLDFIQEVRFDHVGAFQFSFEEGTASQALGDPVPAQVKQERWERLMETQQAISLAKNQALIGNTLDVLIEGQGELLEEGKKKAHAGAISLGRSYRDAPEIDGLVIVENELPVGSLVPVYITGAMPYDLNGVVLTPEKSQIDVSQQRDNDR